MHGKNSKREVVMAIKKKTDLSENQSFKIKYIFQDDYNPIYINGAYGGVMPSGEIVANFYFERHPLPNSETWTQDKQDLEPRDLASSAVRVIETGIIMSPQTARQIVKWLQEKIHLTEAINSQGEDTEQGSEEE